MRKNNIILSLFLIPISISCSPADSADTEQQKIARNIFKEEKKVVHVQEVTWGRFDHEIISTGKTMAINKAEIKFSVTEEIEAIRVHNGEYVEKGEVLAELREDKLKNNLSRKKEALEKALVDLDDHLIGFGHRLSDSTNIPVEVMRMSKVQSGYNSARYDYQDALSALKEAKIKAPFSGKVADLEGRIYNSSSLFQKLCILIDDTKVLVEFNVLETELQAISLNAKVEIVPYGSKVQIMGKVTAINPLIDGNGMVKITAEVDNRKGHLLDGMSVKVLIKNVLPETMYIPKSAVVQRQNREVVFTYEDGLAKWNYVETGMQNSRFVIIESGLEPGQKVIVDNNFNLAHDTEVSLETAADQQN